MEQKPTPQIPIEIPTPPPPPPVAATTPTTTATARHSAVARVRALGVATGFVKARDASQRGARQSTRGYLLDAGFDSPDAAGAPCAFPGDAVG